MKCTGRGFVTNRETSAARATGNQDPWVPGPRTRSSRKLAERYAAASKRMTRTAQLLRSSFCGYASGDAGNRIRRSSAIALVPAAGIRRRYRVWNEGYSKQAVQVQSFGYAQSAVYAVPQREFNTTSLKDSAGVLFRCFPAMIVCLPNSGLKPERTNRPEAS